MAKKVWQCTECGEEFNSGQWLGCEKNETRPHKVESKTYYSMEDGLIINAVPQRKVVTQQGLVDVPGKIPMFSGGQYSTADPEIQEVLDGKGLLTKEEYIDRRTTAEVKAAHLKQVVKEQATALDEAKAELERLKVENAALKAPPTSADQPEELLNEPEPAAAGRKPAPSSRSSKR